MEVERKRQYYTLPEACDMLCLSESSIRKKLREGIIPRAKFCGKVLIPAWFIEQGSTRPTDDNIEIDDQKRDN